MQAVGVLRRVHRLQHGVLVDLAGQRQLDDVPGALRVGVELGDDGEHVGLRGVGGQFAFYLGFTARDLVRGVAVTGAPFTGQPKDNVASRRLAFFLIAGGKDPLAGAIAESKGRLADKKFPVVYREIPDMAHQYLDEVRLDLASLEANADGDVRAKGFLGELRVGQWQVAVTVEALRGRLVAGHPELGFRDGRVDVRVPVEVRPSAGTVVLHFKWDTKGVANLVCRDFETRLVLDGRVLAQRHVLAGELRLAQGDAAAVPVFEQREVPLRLDLSPESWGSVEEALRSQDSLGRCGMLLKPEKVLAELRGLAGKGIDVRLPAALFRPVSLPASLAREVMLGSRTLELSVESGGLSVSRELVWSTASVAAKARD